MRGSITVEWDIEKDGTVSRTAVIGTTLDDRCEVENCVRERVAKWIFANPNQLKATASWGWGFAPPN